MKRIIFLAICLLALTNATFAEGKYQSDTLVDSEPILSRITAYAPRDNKSGICGGGMTSRGYRPNRHYAAVDPRRIPYGTVIFIPGYGEVIAADTGGAL
jgi:3D (Asp-Asp-Asp) domain-containing protein